MKNHITSAIFDTSPEGKRTVQTWVYSALFMLSLLAALLIILPLGNCRTVPQENRREVRLAIQVPSSIQVITRNGELEIVEVIQKETEAKPAASQGKAAGDTKAGPMACPPGKCPPCPCPAMMKSRPGPGPCGPAEKTGPGQPQPVMPTINIRP